MELRRDFPILKQQIHGHSLIYLDNAATLQVPRPVIERVEQFYGSSNGNVHRSSHTLSREAGRQMEQAREQVCRFLHAGAPEEIVWTAGTTDGINHLAQIWADQMLRPGDQVLVTEMEHHSNLLPWQWACQRTGAKLAVVPMDEKGNLNLDALRKLLQTPTKLVAVTWVSNAIGTVNPVGRITEMAHQAGAAVLLDAAQAVLHQSIDVQQVDCDFLVFSGHKMGALTGIGVLYLRRDWLKCLRPVRFGGGMVRAVEGTRAELEDPPWVFEAGTPNYVGAVSLGAAIEYLEQQGLPALMNRSHQLLQQTLDGLEQAGVSILGNPRQRAGAVSFTVPGLEPFDLAQLLDQQGVAVRSGHHCAQNTLAHFGVSRALRVSPAFYNTEEEVGAFLKALADARKMLSL